MITIENFSDIFKCDLLAIAKSGKIQIFHKERFHEEDFLSLVREVMQESNEADQNISQNQIKKEINLTLSDKSNKEMLAKAFIDSSQSSNSKFLLLSGIKINPISKFIQNFNPFHIIC